MSCPFHQTPTGQNGTSATALQSTNPSEIPDGDPIPHPPESWFIGNLGEIDPAFAPSSFWRLADIYGPIYSLNLVNRKVVVVSNYDLINEICDDTNYEKTVVGAQETIRVFSKNGTCVSLCCSPRWTI